MAAPLIALGAFQAVSSYQQAELMREGQILNDTINDMNAKFIEFDAWEAEKFGFTQSARYDTVVNETLGAQKVAFASQGIDSSFGTAALLQAESKLNATLNIADIQKAGHNRALGLRNQAANVRLGGAIQNIQTEIDAAGVQRAGLINAAAIGLSGFNKED